MTRRLVLFLMIAFLFCASSPANVYASPFDEDERDLSAPEWEVPPLSGQYVFHTSQYSGEYDFECYRREYLSQYPYFITKAIIVEGLKNIVLEVDENGDFEASTPLSITHTESNLDNPDWVWTEGATGSYTYSVTVRDAWLAMRGHIEAEDRAMSSVEVTVTANYEIHFESDLKAADGIRQQKQKSDVGRIELLMQGPSEQGLSEPDWSIREIDGQHAPYLYFDLYCGPKQQKTLYERVSLTMTDGSIDTSEQGPDYAEEDYGASGGIDMYFGLVKTEALGAGTRAGNYKTEPAASQESAPAITHYTDAAAAPGEERFSVPTAAFVAAGLVAAASAAVLAASAGKKKRRQGPAARAEQEGEKEAKPKPRYELRVYKNFGDTLFTGKPEAVYARMVEISPNGHEKPADELTCQIRIAVKDYLAISENAMAGGYMGANVLAPEAEDFPPTAVVVFSFRDVYRLEMRFKVDQAAICFAQEKLQLPLGYEQKVYVPFLVHGFGKDKAVDVEVEGDMYSVQLEKDEVDDELYYAVIQEVKAESEAARKAEPEAVGLRKVYALRVTARGNQQQKENELWIFQFVQGLAVDMDALNCYLTPFNSLHARISKREQIIQHRNQQCICAENLFDAALYVWDEKAFAVRVVPPEEMRFNFVLDNEDDARKIESLGIRLNHSGPLDNGHMTLIFRCSRGVLDAPSRLHGRVKITARYGEQSYCRENEIVFRSQPLRINNQADFCSTKVEDDEKFKEILERIQTSIERMGAQEHLFPLVKLIDVMLKGFSPSYGFDLNQMDAVKSVWAGYLNGSVLGANREPEFKEPSLADYLLMAAESICLGARDFGQSLGFCGRLGLGAALFVTAIFFPASLPAIKVTMLSLEVVDKIDLVYEMHESIRDYAYKGGDSYLGAFKAGMGVYLWNETLSGAFSLGIKVAKFGAGTMAKAVFTRLSPARQRAIARGIEKFATSRGHDQKMTREWIASFYDSSGEGRRSAGAITSMKNANANAEIQAKRQLSSPPDDVIPDLERQRKIVKEGAIFAQELLDNMQAARELYLSNRTPLNAKLYKQTVLAVQANKVCMFELKFGADEKMFKYRKALNQVMKVINARAEDITVTRLSKRYGIPKDQIIVINGSSNQAVDISTGKTVPMDLDITVAVRDGDELIVFDQNDVKQIYQEALYQSATGIEAPNAKVAEGFMQALDQTVMNDPSTNPASFGSDLETLTGKKYDVALNDREMVQNALTFKVEEWLHHAEQVRKSLAGIANSAERGIAESKMYADLKEGLRQGLKSFLNYIDPRNTVAVSRGGRGPRFASAEGRGEAAGRYVPQ